MTISAKQEVKHTKAENFYFEFLSQKDDSIQLGKKNTTFKPLTQVASVPLSLHKVASANMQLSKQASKQKTIMKLSIACTGLSSTVSTIAVFFIFNNLCILVIRFLNM